MPKFEEHMAGSTNSGGEEPIWRTRTTTASLSSLLRSPRGLATDSLTEEKLLRVSEEEESLDFGLFEVFDVNIILDNPRWVRARVWRHCSSWRDTREGWYISRQGVF